MSTPDTNTIPPGRGRRMRGAIVLLAWLVLAPIAVLAPSAAADADVFEPATHETVAGPAAVEFGQRLSGGSTMLAARGAMASYIGITVPLLERPDFRIWPHENLNQLVNLDSFLMITDGFRTQSFCLPCGWPLHIQHTAVPYGATFEFEETATGVRTKEDCFGPGAPWFPGLEDSSSFPFCGKEWEHSSSVTGQVEARARVNFLVFTSVGIVYPAQSPASETKTLNVGEVQTIGQTIALPVVEAPGGSDSGGFCSVWGINVACWIGDKAVDLAIDAILTAAPFLREVADFFEGCADAALEAAGGLVDILRELKDAITNPHQFVTEKLQEFRDLIEAIREDPRAFAEEVLGDLARLDTLDEEGVSQWLGELTCMLAIEYFTGKAAAKIVDTANDWLRRRRDRDRPDPDCVVASFPGETQVVMADGSLQRIDTIRPGDRVLSHDLDTSVWEPRLVLQQWSLVDRGPPATVTLTDGSSVTATADHRFWRLDPGDWVELQDVSPGDRFLTPDGAVEVAAIAVGEAQPWTVWELTVEDNHNFAVVAGDHELLVHNYTCQPSPTQLRDRSQDTVDRLRAEGLDVTAEEVAQAWQNYLRNNPDADFDTWQRQYENIRRNNRVGSAYEAEILDRYPGDLGRNGQTFPDPDGGADFKPDAVLSTDPPHFVEIKDYHDTVLYPGSNAGKQLKYITEHAIENPTNPGTFDLHISDPSNISPGMRDLIRDAEAAGVTVRINPDPP